jgi:class 3 adenylate cyclase
MDDRMKRLVGTLEGSRWASLLVDRDWTLVWLSESLKQFLGETDDAKLGVGGHCLDALTSDVWLRTATAESAARVFNDLAPPFVGHYRAQGGPIPAAPDYFQQLLEQVEPKPMPEILQTSIDYISPTDPELPTYRVHMIFTQLKDENGGFNGLVMFCFMDISPNLVALLARGDESMYQRMANLTDPGTRQAAILFCDLAGSGRLSRQLPSSAYFRLVRELWTGIDNTVAQNRGIIGKHAGDGASAFFLVEDLGSPSQAAHAAIATARRIHELSAGSFAEVIDSPCLMRIGLHWGGSIFMGQLVPGGRLDVTALGDEVNECARIQESADRDVTLASKQLVEQLDDGDAASLGLDLEKLHYTPLSELPSATEKAVRDAAGVAVTQI